MNTVYFLQRSNGDIKIGYTAQLRARIIALRAKHGDCSLLGVIEGGYELEAELHERFAEFRLKAHRVYRCDWFEPAQEIIDFIRANSVSLTSRTTALTKVPRSWSNAEKICNLVSVLHRELTDTDFQLVLRDNLWKLDCTVEELIKQRGLDVNRGGYRERTKKDEFTCLE